MLSHLNELVSYCVHYLNTVVTKLWKAIRGSWFTKDNHLSSGIPFGNALTAVIIFIGIRSRRGWGVHRNLLYCFNTYISACSILELIIRIRKRMILLQFSYIYSHFSCTSCKTTTNLDVSSMNPNCQLTIWILKSIPQ